MVLIALNAVMRPAPDQCTEANEELNQNRGRVRFRIRLNHTDELAGDSMQRSVVQSGRPDRALYDRFRCVGNCGRGSEYRRRGKIAERGTWTRCRPICRISLLRQFE